MIGMVFEVVGQNMQEIVLDSPYTVLLMFYNPGIYNMVIIYIIYTYYTDVHIQYTMPIF